MKKQATHFIEQWVVKSKEDHFRFTEVTPIENLKHAIDATKFLRDELKTVCIFKIKCKNN